MQSVGYVSGEEPQALGEVYKGMESGAVYMGTGQTVFLNLTDCDQTPQAGQKFQVVRVLPDVVRDPATGRKLGRVHLFPGVIQVTEAKPDRATAVVIQATDAVCPEDKIIPYVPRPTSVILKTATRPAEGRVLGGQRGSVELGPGDLIFLGVGSSEGIEPGMGMSLWREKENAGGCAPGAFAASLLGQATVLLVLPETSTALITYTTEQIEAGDVAKFGPGVEAQARSEAGPGK
jgi:hypothetical protein